MSLLVSMLPIYVVGNLHCLGMCGPLALLIGRHRHRSAYLLGRGLSFALAGLVAGSLGAVLGVALQRWYVSAAASLLFGGVVCGLGLLKLLRLSLPCPAWITGVTGRLSHTLTQLPLKGGAFPLFTFGFCTILLPCGQTVIVFAACAVSGKPLTGLLNGAVFALLTTPALLLAMHARSLLTHAKRHYATIMGVLMLLVGALALGRGCADLALIPHLRCGHLILIRLYGLISRATWGPKRREARHRQVRSPPGGW